MKCIHCGQTVEPGNIYCPYCAKPLQIVPDYNELSDNDFLKKMIDNETLSSQTSAAESTGKSAATGRTKQSAHTKASGHRPTKKIVVAGIVTAVVLTVFIVSVTVIFMIRKSHENSFSYQLKQAQYSIEQKDYESAIGYYEHASALDEQNLDVRLELLKLYSQMGNRYDDAKLVLCQEILRLDSENFSAYREMVKAYANQNRMEEIASLAEDIKSEKLLKAFEGYIPQPPVFSKKGGTFHEFMTLELDSAQTKDKIYFTMDGSDPVKNGDLYREPIALDKLETYKISAVCKNEYNLFSPVRTETFIIDIDAPDIPIVTPDGNPGGEPFYSETFITVKVPDGCSAYYTWDGTKPDDTSSRYTEPILIPEGNNVLSVILIDDKTGLISDVYTNFFIYYPEGTVAS